MGNGASQSLRAGRHSDSRLSAMRREDAQAQSDTSHGRCSHSATLPFHFEPGDAFSKPRARSLPGSDAASVAAEAASQHHLGLQALVEGLEDHSSSAASLGTSNNEASPRSPDDPYNDCGGGYYDTEHFEDDTIEWKRGEPLGAGSYGTVYLARDERTGALMAVKEIVVADESDDDVRHASREVELLRSLRHPNIVKYLGSRVDEATRKLHIFTEWVPGGNLEQNRKRFGGSERVVRRFTRQILLGVAYLHARRVIHHDIKPSNLLVDQFGVVKLADFGASRLLATSTLVNNESMRGTPNYMAPEVIRQSGPRTVASDIWSVGCSVLRLLTGKPLWGDLRFDSQIALLYYIAHLEQLPSLPESLSPDARSFLELCLTMDPARRPSAQELLTHAFVGGTTGSFMLPSRSTLLPVHEPSLVVRSNTAPAEPHHVEKHASVPHRPPASAPALSRGLSNEPHVKTGETVDDNESDDRPEVLSVRAKAFHHRSSRALGTAAASMLGGLSVSAKKNDDEAEDVYTFSEFAETVVTTPRVLLPAPRASPTWDDQPILTDAARIERERQLTKAAEEKRRKDDRERQFQEELVEFRRSLAVQQR